MTSAYHITSIKSTTSPSSHLHSPVYVYDDPITLSSKVHESVPPDDINPTLSKSRRETSSSRPFAAPIFLILVLICYAGSSSTLTSRTESESCAGGELQDRELLGKISRTLVLLNTAMAQMGPTVSYGYRSILPVNVSLPSEYVSQTPKACDSIQYFQSLKSMAAIFDAADGTYVKYSILPGVAVADGLCIWGRDLAPINYPPAVYTSDGPEYYQADPDWKPLERNLIAKGTQTVDEVKNLAQGAIADFCQYEQKLRAVKISSLWQIYTPPNGAFTGLKFYQADGPYYRAPADCYALGAFTLPTRT